jgi:hypothetical protein
MKFRTLAVLVALLTPTLAFALSQEFKDWANSPQAYFMTKEERAQWASIVTDAEAEKFVIDYRARRGAGFIDQVADRATNADKYLTIGKTKPASKTLRGKVIVLLGPPSGISTETKKGRVDRSATPDMAMSFAGSGGDNGPAVGDMMQVAQQSGMSGKQGYVEYTIKYSGENLPPAYASGVTIKVDVDPNTGEDWLPDRKAQSDLDELFSAVITTQLRNAAPKP